MATNCEGLEDHENRTSAALLVAVEGNQAGLLGDSRPVSSRTVWIWVSILA